MTATKIQWRVQVKAKSGKWTNAGLFETRANARYSALLYRTHYRYERGLRIPPAGFGNTRVVRYVKGQK